MRVAKRGTFFGFTLGLLLLAVAVAPASGALPPYESDPTLSLTGDCSVTPADPIPDPGCPYSPPPAGPVKQFEEPRAVAIDGHGNEYVAVYAAGDDSKGRVDVFDDEGKFITEVTVPDPRTIAVDSKGNFYVSDNDGTVKRYPPSKYEPDAGAIEYKNPAVTVPTGNFVGAVAVDTSPGHLDQLLVTHSGAIDRYKSAAEGNGLIETFKPTGLGAWPEAIAVDSQRRRIYVSFCKDENTECGVKVLEADAPHSLLEELDGSTTPAGEFATLSGLLAIAVDETTGDFFVADISAKRIYQFNEEYELISELSVSELQPGGRIAISNGTRSLAADPCGYPTDPTPPAGDACNRHYLFVTIFKVKGRVAAFHPPGQTAPIIEEGSTGGIGETEAELQGKIFPGGLKTNYQFEITTQASYEANGWNGATVFGQGTIQAEALATEVDAFASSLVPGETYRFRVVADNELGSAGEEGQNEAVFTTYDDAVVSPVCPNEALRLGPSVLLPDCRTYELVTPADTSGRSPKGIGFPVNDNFPSVQASPSGNAVSFKIEGGSLPGTSGVGSFEGDPYVAKRTNSGWKTELAGPSGDEVAVAIPASRSSDQGFSFWTARIEGPLVINGEETEYLHYPDGHSELIGRGSLGVAPRAQGLLITEDAHHVIFTTVDAFPAVAVQLEPDAPPTGTEAIYDRTIDPDTGLEETHTVSLLPGNLTPAAGQDATYQGASQDGVGIAFSIGSTLYLRVDNKVTFQVGTGVEFAGVSEGGSRIFYLEGGKLEAFDVASEEVIDFAATGDAVPVNVAADGNRAYFVSEEVLGAANPEGEEAQAGEQNLYLSEEGAISFVATVTERDVEGEPPPLGGNNHDGLGLWTQVVGDQLAADPSRLNPDGSVLLFQSRAEITGYEESEFPQIYRYDTDAGTLLCLSCNPTGVPATGGAALENYTFDTFLPQPFSPFGLVPNMNPAGTRVFFDSTEALVSTDSDEVTDVYEWEANGIGSCTRPQGCVYLISTGQSARDNYLYGHSSSGNDVFFTTGDRLTGWDSNEGTTSIYDARIGGGFPEPAPVEECVGEGCQSNPQSPSPQLAAPTTKSVGRSGNHQAPKTCPKGKRKVKKNGTVRCVKKQKKHNGAKAKQRASANRGAGK